MDPSRVQYPRILRPPSPAEEVIPNGPGLSRHRWTSFYPPLFYRLLCYSIRAETVHLTYQSPLSLDQSNYTALLKCYEDVGKRTASIGSTPVDGEWCGRVSGRDGEQVPGNAWEPPQAGSNCAPAISLR